MRYDDERVKIILLYALNSTLKNPAKKQWDKIGRKGNPPSLLWELWRTRKNGKVMENG